MAKHRVERLAGELQKELAVILDREIKDPRLGMVSVVSVDIAPDGCSARVYISPMISGAAGRSSDAKSTAAKSQDAKSQDAKSVKAALESAKGYIRMELGKRLKTRAVPELYFQVDESIAYGVRMTKMVDAQIAADEKAAAGRPPFNQDNYRD
jgi:ribosome-binding factor A